MRQAPWAARLCLRVQQSAARAGRKLVDTPASWVVFAGTFLPWFTLPVLSPAAPRLWGLWGLQVCLLVGCLSVVARQLNWPFWARVSTALVVIASLTASTCWTRTCAVAANGFAGRPALSVVVADTLASELKGAKLAAAKLGYLIAFDDWEADYHSVEPAYHVGMQFDTYLKYQHGLTNLSPRDIGFGPDDQYRLVQMTIDADHGVVDVTRPKRFIFPDQDRFEKIHDLGGYQIWRRREVTKP